MATQFLFFMIKIAIVIAIFIIFVVILNRTLLSLEKKGIITSTVKRRVSAITISIVGVLITLVLIYELSSHTFFLYLFLIIFGVSAASTYPVLNNFYAHYAIVNTRQIVSGVHFSIGKIKGKIKNIGYMYTQLILDDGSIVYIPNNYMLKKPFRIFRPHGKIRAKISLLTQSPLNIESIANKIEEGIRRNFRHLSSDSDISVIVEKVDESVVSFTVEVEYMSSDVREKVVNNLIEALYTNLFEYSPSIEILKD